MDYIYKSLSEFFIDLAKYVTLDYIMLGAFGLLLLVLIAALIRTAFTYEVRLLRTVNRLNRYFLKEPYVTDENLIRFNKKMKRVPRTLRYCWQEFLLNRDKAPSEYMSVLTCVDQPSKASGYQNTVTSIGTYTTIISVLTLLMSIISFYNDNSAAVRIQHLFDLLILPALIIVIGFLFVAFMRARHTSIVADLYFSFHEFERGMNKACTTLPQFIDYEILFTKKEIREGIPVLQEYLEKRALQEKIEQEEAKLNSLTYEEFNFNELGIENALLLERALFESEKYFKVKSELDEKLKSKETEMQNYQKAFDEVTKDYERKAQALRETLQQLTDQINSTTIKIESNYMKKRYHEEQQKLQQLEKDYETSITRFQKQQDDLEAEIESFKSELKRRKAILEEAMSAEGKTYARKIYNVITQDVQEQSRPYLEQIEQIKTDLETQVGTLTNELDYKKNELFDVTNKYEKVLNEYQIKLVGLQSIKELKEYLTSAEYKQKLLDTPVEIDGNNDTTGKELKVEDLKIAHAEQEKELKLKIEKLETEIKLKEEELKSSANNKKELETRIYELNRLNKSLQDELDRLSRKYNERNRLLETIAIKTAKGAKAKKNKKDKNLAPSVEELVNTVQFEDIETVTSLTNEPFELRENNYVKELETETDFDGDFSKAFVTPFVASEQPEKVAEEKTKNVSVTPLSAGLLEEIKNETDHEITEIPVEILENREIKQAVPEFVAKNQKISKQEQENEEFLVGDKTKLQVSEPKEVKEVSAPKEQEIKVEVVKGTLMSEKPVVEKPQLEELEDDGKPKTPRRSLQRKGAKKPVTKKTVTTPKTQVTKQLGKPNEKITDKEIEELNALKQKIEAESKVLDSNKKELDTAISSAIKATSTAKPKTTASKTPAKTTANKPVVSVKKPSEEIDTSALKNIKKSIGASLNELLEEVEKIEKKDTKPKK